MLSSKELIEKTGISRATLSNYINLGILSKPTVIQPGKEGGGARLLGYFPDSALDRIEHVQRMKQEGHSMAEIVATIGKEMALAEGTGNPRAPEALHGAERVHPPVLGEPEQGGLKLTIDDIPYPAYMVNYNLELAWHNEPARHALLGAFETLPANTEARNIFLLLARAGKPAASLTELFRLHLCLAKGRHTKASILGACRELDARYLQLLDSLYEEVEAHSAQGIMQRLLDIGESPEKAELWCTHAAFFREGILFVFVPDGTDSESLLDFLSRRDLVIRNLLRRRLPVLTRLTVMVADLQHSVKICAELPPEEYFELINEIWATMGPIFRRHYATHGKHVGDGMVYYFFPQPDSHYVFNALGCAHEVKMAMQKISKDWQIRKNWLNELYLNVGLHEGQEWLGTFQSATSVEFAVLGDTINHAARLSEFARFGSVWATKNFLGSLTPEQRARVEFGVTRRGPEGQEHFVASSYSQLANLIDLSSDRYEKLRAIAALPITEIRSVKSNP